MTGGKQIHKHCMICQRVEVDGVWLPVEEFRAKYPETHATSGYCAQECWLSHMSELPEKLRNKIIKLNKENACRLSPLKPS